MPSGYTHDVQTGKITELSAFAMSCARAFGALISMRDEPLDAPVPDRLEPNTEFYDKALASARITMDEVPSLSVGDCDQRAAEEFEQALAQYVERQAERYKEEVRYKGMIEKVEQWQVPEAIGVLRVFMLEQLLESVKFDCNYKPERPIRLTGEDWRKGQLRQASRDLAYHAEERDKEIERSRDRNEWLADLRRSLEAGATHDPLPRRRPTA